MGAPSINVVQVILTSLSGFSSPVTKRS